MSTWEEFQILDFQIRDIPPAVLMTQNSGSHTCLLISVAVPTLTSSEGWHVILLLTFFRGKEIPQRLSMMHIGYVICTNLDILIKKFSLFLF